MIIKPSNFSSALHYAFSSLLNNGDSIETENWQGIQVNKPMKEFLNFCVTVRIPTTKQELRKDIDPDLPWSEDHFQERIGGEPTNPGGTYRYWPYYKQDESWRKDSKFSHTYQERLWTGEYPNLGDVVYKLKGDLTTRQAFVPIWFPEDTGAINIRVPCTIGYHFIVRNNKVHITHYIRAVDAIRHLKNDFYLTARMGQWMADQLEVEVGDMTFLATSLHCFQSDLYELKKRKSALCVDFHI